MERTLADPESLSALTGAFVVRSPSYCGRAPDARAAADLVVARATQQLAALAPSSKAQCVDAYKANVHALAIDGWLTPTQAALLRHFADTL
jgi:hypothetical protein